MTFLHIGIIDIIDILLVALLFYQIYSLIKGTVAIKIFIGIAAFYLIWLLVKALNMKLLSSILGQVMGVGVIALLIVFQQEIRRFFLLISSKYFPKIDFSIENFMAFLIKQKSHLILEPILRAVQEFSITKTGALIVIGNKSELITYIETGIVLNAEISEMLLSSIFFKNSSMHDGAVIIIKNKIRSASCILPVSGRKDLPQEFGLRHRAAVGMSEQTDAIIIVVSEQTGRISVFCENNYKTDISVEYLENFITEIFGKNPDNIVEIDQNPNDINFSPI
jgi:uncharacterized protein (TIGR00159 family)